MGNNNYKDPDLIEAINELDKEFPVSGIDDSLKNHLQHIRNNKNKKILFKKILFHFFFYLAYSFIIFLLFSDYKLSIPGSMTFGITYFLIFYAFFKTKKRKGK